MNNLMEIKSTIKSTELVDIINTFRATEGNKTKLQHKDFMTKIRKELEMLKNLGLEDKRNFSPTSYVDSQNRNKPCYELNRDGMLEMLNSESAYVRYKTIEYINKLEEENKNIKLPSSYEDLMIRQLQEQKKIKSEIEATKDDVKSHDTRIQKIENNMTIDHAQQEKLNRYGRTKVVEMLGGKDSPAYKVLGKKAFPRFWNNYKRVFGVSSYKDTAIKDIDKAYTFIDNWKPGEEFGLAIRGANAQISIVKRKEVE